MRPPSRQLVEFAFLFPALQGALCDLEMHAVLRWKRNAPEPARGIEETRQDQQASKALVVTLDVELALQFDLDCQAPGMIRRILSELDRSILLPELYPSGACHACRAQHGVEIGNLFP